MTQPRFEVHQPTTLEEALDLLARHRTSVRVLAGGTALLPGLRAGSLAVAHLVSVNRVRGLRQIGFAEDDGLVIGAGARLSEVADHSAVQRHYPALAAACREMATPQVRHMATVAGNLAGAAPFADAAVALLAHQASLVLVERGGRRQVELDRFFTGPGGHVMEPMEMIEAIRVPAPPRRSGSCYRRLASPGRVDRPVAGVAGFLTLDLGGGILGARLALGGVASIPRRCPEAEALLLGQKPDEALFRRAAAACVRAAHPADDPLASANYRRLMVAVLAERVLKACLARALEA